MRYRHLIFTLLALTWGGACEMRGAFTLDDRMESDGWPDPFSEAFKNGYAAAFNSGDTNSLIAFEKMLAKYKLPHEQAELETVVGIRYGQTRGLINPAKATAHFGNALKFELPPLVRLQIHVWRGNSFEQLKQFKQALTEYLQGMQITLDYKLPPSKPQLPAVGMFDVTGSPSDPRFQEVMAKIKAKRQSQIEQRNQAMFDLKLAQLRFSVIDACKRVGGNQDNVQAIAQTITRDESRAQKLVELFSSPNNRPWN